MRFVSSRRLSLFMSVVACTLLATTVHAQTQPGAGNGGLTATLPNTGSGATPMVLTGTQAGPSTRVTPSAWLQAFLLPSWPALFVRDETVRRQVTVRRAVRTR